MAQDIENSAPESETTTADTIEPKLLHPDAQIMQHESEQTPQAHTAESIINIYANALNNDARKELLFLRGIYRSGNGHSERGYYFDRLVDITGGYQLTLRMPEKLRSDLASGMQIACRGYLSERTQMEGRIELLFSVTEIIEAQVLDNATTALDAADLPPTLEDLLEQNQLYRHKLNELESLNKELTQQIRLLQLPVPMSEEEVAEPEGRLIYELPEESPPRMMQALLMGIGILLLVAVIAALLYVILPPFLR